MSIFKRLRDLTMSNVNSMIDKAEDPVKMTDQYNREPCPWRILGDCGGAFSMGILGGGLFNFVGGARNAPAGYQRRALGGLIRMRERVL